MEVDGAFLCDDLIEGRLLFTLVVLTSFTWSHYAARNKKFQSTNCKKLGGKILASVRCACTRISDSAKVIKESFKYTLY